MKRFCPVTFNCICTKKGFFYNQGKKLAGLAGPLVSVYVFLFPMCIVLFPCMQSLLRVVMSISVQSPSLRNPFFPSSPHFRVVPYSYNNLLSVSVFSPLSVQCVVSSVSSPYVSALVTALTPKLDHRLDLIQQQRKHSAKRRNQPSLTQPCRYSRIVLQLCTQNSASFLVYAYSNIQ